MQRLFWYSPVENGDDTNGLSKKSSWKVNGKYASEPFNKVYVSHEVGETNGPKDVPICVIKKDVVKNNSKGESNNQKSVREIKAKKRAMNSRYKKNLNERKQFWKKKKNMTNDQKVDSNSQNSNQKFVDTSRPDDRNIH